MKQAIASVNTIDDELVFLSDQENQEKDRRRLNNMYIRSGIKSIKTIKSTIKDEKKKAKKERKRQQIEESIEQNTDQSM